MRQVIYIITAKIQAALLGVLKQKYEKLEAQILL